MAATPLPPDNSVPFELGWHYLLAPGGSTGDWVEIVGLTPKTVTVKGVDNTIAEWSAPVWKFDDLVRDYRITGFLLATEDGRYIITEDQKYIFVEKYVDKEFFEAEILAEANDNVTTEISDLLTTEGF